MTSNPSFNDKTTATEAAQALGASIKDKNVIVTGVGPNSLGLSTAVAIASQAPKTLILASRTPSKLDAVAAEIAQKHPSAKVHKVVLDLASLDSIKAAVEQINSLVDRVDVLINNAGVNSARRDEIKTLSGTVVDLMFFINHVGPFFFTSLLLPKLRAAASASKGPKGATRVVNISSVGHVLSPVRFHDYQFAQWSKDEKLDAPDKEQPPSLIPEGFMRLVDGYPGFLAYGQSKTANILHATELARRLRRAGDDISAFSVHPGTIDTDLSRHTLPEDRALFAETNEGMKRKTLDQGSSTTVVAAFDPALGALGVGEDGAGGVVGYLVDCQLADEAVWWWAKDKEMAEKLWVASEGMVGTKTGL